MCISIPAYEYNQELHFLTCVSDFSYCKDGATWLLLILIGFLPESPVVSPPFLPYRQLG